MHTSIQGSKRYMKYLGNWKKVGIKQQSLTNIQDWTNSKKAKNTQLFWNKFNVSDYNTLFFLPRVKLNGNNRRETKITVLWVSGRFELSRVRVIASQLYLLLLGYISDQFTSTLRNQVHSSRYVQQLTFLTCKGVAFFRERKVIVEHSS